MAYESHLCTCPEDSKLVFLDHLRDCPEVAPQDELAEHIDRELQEFREDAALLRALAPEPPRELIVFICAGCGRPYLSRAQLMKCHNSGRWVREGIHYYSQRYVPD